MEEIQETILMRSYDIISGFCSAKGLRNENQDSYGILSESNLPSYIVADGAGGYSFGKESSKLACNAFIKEISMITVLESEYYEDIIMKKYAQVNKFLFDKSIEMGKKMMTTFSMVSLNGDKVLISNVGDTIIFKINKNGIKRVSQLHSLAWEQYEKKIISYEEYVNHPKKNVITRALGGTETVNPYMSFETISDKDIYVLCTDGVYNYVTEDEIFNSFYNRELTDKEINEECNRIIEKALYRKGNDNLTIVALQIINKG